MEVNNMLIWLGICPDTDIYTTYVLGSMDPS